MRLVKKIAMLLLVLFIAIQFIRPSRNRSGQVLSGGLTQTIPVPDIVQDLLSNSCYDCHSNNTRYPWYVNIQPMGWQMARHIQQGKENLNFDEFGLYSKRKQANKLRAIATSITGGSMPIASYTIMHTDARLNKEQVALVSKWALNTRDSLLQLNK